LPKGQSPHLEDNFVDDSSLTCGFIKFGRATANGIQFGLGEFSVIEGVHDLSPSS
jgi:hypothetical protein